MKRRCFRCHNLSEESPFKYYQRTKKDLDVKFFCRKCFKKQHEPYVKKPEKIKLDTECQNICMKWRTLEDKEKLTHEERIERGRLIRKGIPKLNELFDMSTCTCRGCENSRLLKMIRKRGQYRKFTSENLLTV